jgi:hypothetical protein
MNGLSPNPFMDQKYYSDFNDSYSTTNGIVRFVKGKRRWAVEFVSKSWQLGKMPPPVGFGRVGL